ncbi:hypothetical protein [Mordavella massiliensis]|uniref:Uncharacterized protein n=1 Tax=Mordavella massiliensis TaxID=1871024 RepID=A0A939BCU6_9CLOT|nr:hypothetical protein [Mordavella massiliensis]MBM6827979.1 hypothetical protein [Mordavella massiliensis]
MTIPDIRYIHGRMALGEINDIHRFSNSIRLLAFDGLDSSVYQSRNFLLSETYPYMKQIAIMMPDAKMVENRPHYNVLWHCANKLIRVIWKMLTDNVEFNLD